MCEKADFITTIWNCHISKTTDATRRYL